MSYCKALLALSITVVLSACGNQPQSDAAPTAAADPAETADQFVARVNQTMVKETPLQTSAAWIGSTYINDDSARIESASNERALGQLSQWVAEAAKFDGDLSAATARSLKLLKLSSPNPAPSDPEKLAELAQLTTRMQGAYGAGKYCTDEKDPTSCRNLGDLSEVLAKNRGYDAQLEAWQGWHSIAPALKPDYQRFAELVNEGARDIGFADAGELWRSGYDMSPAEVMTETDRLWGQVQPLYEQLHCYARGKLVEHYGERGQVNGMIPAHLTGNMWQQDWSNLWQYLQPYPNAGSLDITSKLEAQREARLREELAKLDAKAEVVDLAEAHFRADYAQATAMTRLAESFYVSLGMPSLPESFYTDSQLTKPRDREVVCHASAWPMDTTGQVRIKMCIKPTEEELTTIYHELGHIYYYLAYKDQPPLFQSGAHDGFHEAIGDTIVLSMTPEYLASIGLLDNAELSEEATVNAQMRMALSNVAFMPFGLLIDRWRWGVFDGSITPDHYNQAWWDLKAKYQGVAPVSERGEEFFDPGAKYHVPANTPYTRYFLARVLQFQFYKALCDAAGHTGPLHSCSFAGNTEAGAKYWEMLKRGQSQPWQQTLAELTGGESMDASAILEYFAPLQAWLTEQNAGKTCGY